MDLASVRRKNLLRLWSDFVASRQQDHPVLAGLDKEFTVKIDVNNTYFSGMKSGARGIGEKLARQIEAKTGKPKGWLDVEHEDADSSPRDLKRFLELAETAYLTSDLQGRAELRAALKKRLPGGA